MARRLLPALGSLLAASCLVPSMEIVDSFGDSGEAGEGAAGTSSGAGGKGSGGSAGSSAGAGGTGRGGQAGAGGNPAGGTAQEAGASGAEDSAGTNAGGRGSGGSAGSQSAGTGNGGSGNVGSGGEGGEDGGGSSGTSGGGASGTGNGGSSGSAGSSGGTGGSSNAGAGGSGPVTVSCTSYNVAADGYVAAPMAADDCIKGFAFTALDSGSMAMPRSFESCGEGCVLAVTGVVGPANDENTYAGFFLLGLNLNQTRSGAALPFTPQGSGLRVTYTYVGNTDIRAQIEVGNTRWCVALAPAMGQLTATIPYANFATECYLPGGSAYGGQPIEAFHLVLPGEPDPQSFSLTLHAFEEY